jgi:hypothetical protein
MRRSVMCSCDRNKVQHLVFIEEVSIPRFLHVHLCSAARSYLSMPRLLPLFRSPVGGGSKLAQFPRRRNAPSFHSHVFSKFLSIMINMVQHGSSRFSTRQSTGYQSVSRRRFPLIS